MSYLNHHVEIESLRFFQVCSCCFVKSERNILLLFHEMISYNTFDIIPNFNSYPLSGTSRIDENSPSQWSHISTRRKKKQTPKPKTPSIDSNPIVLLNDCDIVHISPKLTGRVCKNQSVQTQSSFDSKSTFDTKSTVDTKSTKQTVVTSVCKSCKKKTPMRVRNFGSYENEEEDDDEDFVSNDVSNLSGIKRLGVRSEGKAKQQGDTGKIMEGKRVLFSPL